MERGLTVWVTSASADAARAVAADIAEALAGRELPVELLHAGRPGFEHIPDPRGLAAVAAMLAARGISSVVAEAVSSSAVRDAARAQTGCLIEVLVTSGAPAVPGWQAPAQAEAEVGSGEGPAAVSRVLRTLELLGYLRAPDDQAYSADEEREVIARLKAFGYL